MKKNKNKNTRKTIRNRKRKDKRKGILPIIFYMPLYLLVLFIPHAYALREHKLSVFEAELFNTSQIYDVYTSIKSEHIIAYTIIAILLFVVAKLNYQIEIKSKVLKFLVPIASIYFALSYFLTEYKEIVIFGAKDRNEGIIIHICYLVLIFIASVYAVNRKFVENTLKFLHISTFIMSIIAFLQFLRFDIYTMSPLKWLFFPKEIAENSEKYISVEMTQGSIGSLFNANYSGVFMIFGVFIAFYLLFKTEEKYKKILYFLSTISLSFALFTSNSEASVLAFSVGFPAFLYFAYNRIKKHKTFVIAFYLILITEVLLAMKFNNLSLDRQKHMYIIFALFSILAIILARFSFKRTRVLSYSLATLVFLLIFISPYIMYKILPSNYEEKKTVEYFRAEKDSFKFKTKDMQEEIRFNFNKELNFFDFSNVDTSNYDESSATFHFSKNEKNYSIIVKKIEDKKYALNLTPFNLWFVYYEGFAYLTNDGKLHRQEEIDNIKYSKIFSDKPELFTYRTYIWSRYIPLIQKKLLTGYGPDTYAVIYPRYEHAIKYNLYTDSNMIVDKPHNIYIAWLISFGLIGFLIISIIIVNALKTSYMKLDREDEAMLAILISFLLASVFNDSFLGISVVIFIIIGMMSTKERLQNV